LSAETDGVFVKLAVAYYVSWDRIKRNMLENSKQSGGAEYAPDLGDQRRSGTR
jgi:hypothetical protein